MHIHALRLHAYGHFEDKLLNFAKPGKLSLVYGPNEAGKSTALFALEAFLFGLMDQRTAVSYEKAWSKSKLKVTGWLSSKGADEDIAEIQRSHTGILDRKKLGADDWLPSKGQRALFMELFALDGERLRRQAERVLASDANAGQALGAALLGEQIEQQCKRLESEAEALFKERGKNQTIATLRKELADLDDKIREQALSGQAWSAQERAYEDARAAAADLERARRQTKTEQEVLSRDARRLEASAKLQDLRDALAALQSDYPGLPVLSRDDLNKVEALDRQLSALAGEIKQQESALQALLQEQQKLSLNDGLWALHQERQQADGQGLAGLSQKLSDWRALLDARPQQAQSEEIAPAEAEHLRSQEAALSRLQEALEATSNLPDKPEQPELPAGLRVLQGSQIETLLNPALGLAERLASWQQQRALYAQEAVEIATQAKAAQRALEEAEIACQQLKDQGAGLDGQALAEARRQRDQLWDDLKRDLNQPALQRQFEVAQIEADRSADAYARSERQAGAWQAALDRQSRAQLQVAASEKRRQTLTRNEAELLTEIGVALEDSLPELDRSDSARALDQCLTLLAAVQAFDPTWRAWQQQLSAWQAQERHWLELEKRAEALGYAGAAATGGLRAWLKQRAQALRDLKQAEAARINWQGYQQRVAAQADDLRALADTAAGLNIGVGLEPADAVALLHEAFAQETKARDQRARLQMAIERAQRDLGNQKNLQHQQAEQRSNLLAQSWSELGALREASQLEARIEEQSRALDALGVLERWQDGEALEGARQGLSQRYQEQDEALRAAHTAEGVERQALKTLKESGGARDLRFERAAKLEALRQAAAQYLDLGLQARVLRRSLNRFLEQQQDDLLTAASRTFSQLTAGAYQQVDQRRGDDSQPHFWTSDHLGDDKELGALSEGTKDQLFLSLRLAALDQYGLEQLRTAAGVLPLICDDLLVQYDDTRAARALSVLAERRERQQVIYFTHHRHLLDLAARQLDKDSYEVLDLTPGDAESR